MREVGIEGIHVAVEADVTEAALGAPVWMRTDGPRVSAGAASAGTPPSAMPPTRRPRHVPEMPSADIADGAGELGVVATEPNARLCLNQLAG